nr:IclR family transcriptional regulator [Nitrosomonas nitrosa]
MPEISGVKVLDRLMAIFSVYSSDRDEFSELSLSDVAEKAGIDKGTTHRLLAAAAKHNLIEQDPKSRKYRLGLRFFEFGTLAVLRFGISQAAHSLIVDLSRSTGETVNLAVLSEGEALCVDKAESERPFRFPAQVGLRLPAHCTSAGKVLLTALSERELREIVDKKGLSRRTPQTITSFDELTRELESVRRRGYALDDEELEIGLRCVSAPVYDQTRTVVAALSIPAPAARFAKSEIPARVDMLMTAADRISQRLGYVSDAAHPPAMGDTPARALSSK